MQFWKREKVLLKAITIFLAAFLLWVLSRTPYVNLFFPLWFSMTLLSGLTMFLYKWTISALSYFLLSLWLVTITFLLLKQAVIADQISITVYIILFYITLNSFFESAKGQKK